MAIQILENTLLKLLVRRGNDYDRTQITLDAGELGYTTDTKRLYIGDGSTAGGNIIGNIYKGKVANVTSLAPGVVGDYAFETSSNQLKVLIQNTGSAAADWYGMGNVLSAGNTTINVDSASRITVDSLSAGNISYSALGNSLEIDTDSKVALSGTVKIDTILQKTIDATSYLELPSKIKINSIDYNFPASTPANNSYLGADAEGTLSWTPPQIITTAVAPTTAVLVPVGTIVPYASASAAVPYGWLPCDGSAVSRTIHSDLFEVIDTAYGAGNGSTTFNVPNLTNRTVYGDTSPAPANSTEYQLTTAAPTHSLSATATNFIIKSIGGVTSPTLTVAGNLSGFLNERGQSFNTPFSFLSGDLKLQRVVPGIKVFNNGGSSENFTIPEGVQWVKFYITGSGAPGNDKSGGAAATIIGYLSAAPGTEFICNVAAAPTNNAATGIASTILLASNGTTIATANGGQGYTSGLIFPPAAASSGTVSDTTRVISHYIVPGGSGGIDTDKGGNEEASGAASFWGSAPAPGAGGGSHGNRKPRDGGDFVNYTGLQPGAGLIKFEWS